MSGKWRRWRVHRPAKLRISPGPGRQTLNPPPSPERMPQPSGTAATSALALARSKKRARPRLLGAGHIPGDDLLSQDLSSHYHRRCGVSLPGSEWDRVVPPRSGHQRAIEVSEDAASFNSLTEALMA